MRQMSLLIFGNYGFFVRFVFYKNKLVLVFHIAYITVGHCVAHTTRAKCPRHPTIHYAFN